MIWKMCFIALQWLSLQWMGGKCFILFFLPIMIQRVNGKKKTNNKIDLLTFFPNCFRALSFIEGIENLLILNTTNIYPHLRFDMS